MSYFYRINAILVMLVACIETVSSQCVAEVDTSKILVGAQTDYNIKVTARKGASVVFPAFKSGDNITKGVEIISLKNDTSNVGNDSVMLIRNIRITAWEQGKFTIPTQKVSVDGKVAMTSPITIIVNEVKVDTANVNSIRPPKDVQDNPFSIRDWLPVIILAILLAICVYGSIYLFRRVRQQKPILIGFKPPIVKTPFEVAVNAVRNITVPMDNDVQTIKEYYSELTDILRTYISERFAFNAMEMVSTDIIEKLRDEKECSDNIKELEDVLMTADMAKFAKYTVMSNIMRMHHGQIESFFIRTRKGDLQALETQKKEIMKKQYSTAYKWMQTGAWLLALLSLAMLSYMVYRIYLLV